jgi:DNA repair exonuclease SbcCD ATPase subunit
VSTVIYGRVSDALKQALAAHATERSLSLTAAAVALLERGLDTSEEERAREREGELAACASELERTRARLAEAEAALALAREREQITASTLRVLAERARGELASCPQCRKPLRGYDLLVSGHCPSCGRAITNLLSPRPQMGAPDKDEYLALLGALGGLVGLALASTSGGAD